MITALLLWAAVASAHDYPIRPVRALLRVEPGRTVVDLRTDSIFWIAEVIGAERLPARWPEEARRRVEGYVNAHLRLSADGKPWRGALEHASHRQRPWEAHEEGELRLRMLYPEAPRGAVIAGEADFFKEYRASYLAAGRAPPYADGYRTVLDVPGREAFRFELTPDAPAFSVPADAARRPSWKLALEGLRTGASAAAGAASAWPAVLALALALGPEQAGRRRAAAAALALGAAASLARPVPPAAAWAAGLAGAAAAGDWLGRGGWAAAALGGAALGAAWTAAARPWLPGAPAPAPALAAAWLGALAGGAALLAAAFLACSVERRRAAEDSLSHAAELFARRRRLAATAILIVSGYGLALSLS